MKKVVSLLLVLVLALGMSTVAFAAGEITVGYDGTPGVGGSVSGDTINVGEWLRQGGRDIFLPIEKIIALDGSPIDYPSLAEVNKEKYTVRTSFKSGSKVFDSVSIVGGNQEATLAATGSGRVLKAIHKVAAIRLRAVEWFVNTGDIDFELVITGYQKGSKLAQTEITVYGNFSNEIKDADSGTSILDIADGYVVKASEYNKLIELDIGNGISVFTKLFKDKKYYGVATIDDDEADDAIYKKYPDVDSVITVRSVGLSSTAQYVIFNDFDDVFEVYDANMKHLGKSNQKLAFSSKYYLANKLLNVVSDEDEEPDDEDPSDLPVAPAETGGSGYPANVNDNPGTGR